MDRSPTSSIPLVDLKFFLPLLCFVYHFEGCIPPQKTPKKNRGQKHRRQSGCTTPRWESLRHRWRHAACDGSSLPCIPYPSALWCGKWPKISAIFLGGCSTCTPNLKNVLTFLNFLRKKHKFNVNTFPTSSQCMCSTTRRVEKKQCSILLVRCLFIFCQQFRFGSQPELRIWCFMKFNPFIGWGRFFSIH